MKEVLIDCHIKGIRPLLMNGLGDLEERGIGRGANKKGKIYLDSEEAERRLYKDDVGIICQPASHIESCLVYSGADFKISGSKTYKEPLKAGIFVEPRMLRHQYPSWVIDKRSVVVKRARVIRCRPRFDQWELAFLIYIRDNRIDPLILEEILVSAGQYVGIGDYRPRFGLFEVLSFQIVDTNKEECAGLKSPQR